MDYNLSSGLLEKIMRGTDKQDEHPIMQILACKQMINSQGEDRYCLILSDGKHFVTTAMLAARLNEIVKCNAIPVFTIFKILRYSLQNFNNKQILVILELKVVVNGSIVGKSIGSPVQLNLFNTKQDGCSSTSNNTANVGTSNLISTASSSKSPTKVIYGSSSSESRLICPIVSINPFQLGWTLKATVVKKDTIRHYSNKKVKLFNMIVCDETGDICVTAFNNEVDKFYKMIEVDKAYFIKNCNIKPSNKKYNPTAHDYELTFNCDTTVVECFDIVVPNIQYKFVDIETIETMNENQVVDVIGICKDTSETQHVTQRSTNMDIIKREIVLVDHTNNSIKVTLWEKEAEEFEGSKKPVMLIKAAKINEYLGSKSLSVSRNSMLKIDPDIPEAHRLRGWYDNGGSELETSHISTRTGQSSFRSTREVSLMDVQNLKYGTNVTDDYFHVNAYIGTIKTDNITYMACPKSECNKKVGKEGDLYECIKCNDSTPNFQYRYLMQMEIRDYSGNIWVTCFGEECEKILLKSAKEIGEWLEQDKKSATEYITSKYFQMYSFKCQIKMEFYKEEHRFQTTVKKVTDVDYPKYNNLLITGIKNLLEIE